MGMDRRALGQAGERLAAAHLEHKGHEILRRNVYSAQGEIDLAIARFLRILRSTPDYPPAREMLRLAEDQRG